MTEILSNTIGTELPTENFLSAEEKKKNAAELYRICQDEVIKRLQDDPKNIWRIPYIEEALKNHKYEGSSMDFLAHETAKLMEKYF
jgi:hypothetical protein